MAKKQNTHTHTSVSTLLILRISFQIPDGAEKSPQRHRQVTRDVILLLLLSGIIIIDTGQLSKAIQEIVVSTERSWRSHSS